MFSSTSKKQQMRVPTPHRKMRGHTDSVTGVVHLSSGRRIITCSDDGSLRLWDLKSGAQIGEDWRDEDYDEDHEGMASMALSPNAKTVASGGNIYGTMRLWNVETRKVIAKWTGHTNVACALCWSADGKRVASGSWDGTTRVWDVKSGETVLTIKTGHDSVDAVMYSPDDETIATGGEYENAVKIWDSKTGKLICTTLKYRITVSRSLAWTSDGKKLISSSYGPIRIFDTATWQQIAILEGDTFGADIISLSQNNRILASASSSVEGNTARLWNLDKNLPIGPPLQHEDRMDSAALSADGKTLVTGCQNGNVYTWDIHAILKEAGLEDLLSTGTDIAPKNILEQPASQRNSGIERTPRSSLSGMSFLETDATRCHNEFGGHDDELPPRFFDSMEADVHSSQTDALPHSPASALLARLSSFLHRFRHDDAEATERLQPSTPLRLHLQVLLARLSSLIHHPSPENDGANELQQPSTPSRLDPHALLAQLSSFLPRSRLHTEEETDPQPTTRSRPDALIGRLSSFSRSQAHTNEDIELPQRPWRPHVVDVAPMRDREVLFVAQRSPPDRPHTQSNGTTTPGARPGYSLPVRMLAHLVLFLCCASDGNVQTTQHQQQGQSQTQPPSLQTQPAAASTSTTPTAPVTHTTVPATAQPRPVPLRIRFAYFICCASPPHADGN